VKGYLLQILIEHGIKYKGKSLCSAIEHVCMENNIHGATVFRAIEGYGKSHKIHHHGLFEKNEPVAIEIIDTKENIEKILPVLKNILQELNKGLITLEEVEIVR
jgi:PII-like signaling protein